MLYLYQFGQNLVIDSEDVQKKAFFIVIWA